MTYLPAENWPEFTRKKDTFSSLTVSGYIYQSGPTPPPTTAGPKCNDNIIKVDAANPYWQDLQTGDTYYQNPCPPPATQGSSGTMVKMKKSNWIGLASFRNGRSLSYVAYQLWTPVGQSVLESTLSGTYIRRGGKFTEKSGAEWFKPFENFTTLRYKPRDLYKTYQSQGSAFSSEATAIFNPTSGTTYSAEDIALAQAIAAGLGGVIGATTVVSDPTDDGTSGGGRPPGGGGPPRNKNKNIPATPPLPIPEITITTRMPSGYAGRGVATGARPQMVQRYQTDDDKSADETFIFRYIPQGIKYSGLAGNWVEIPRAEDVPFVDWASWQLMKVSFSFIVAADRTESGGAIVPDGLDESVDSQIEQLRRMAQRKVPVTLMNFDEMLTFQLRRGKKATPTGTQITRPNMEFVIQDLSVTATRRTAAVEAKPPKGAIASMISVAQCEITLTEIPVETVGIIALPPITTPGLPPSKKRPPGPLSQQYALMTDVAVAQERATNSYGVTP